MNSLYNNNSNRNSNSNSLVCLLGIILVLNVAITTNAAFSNLATKSNTKSQMLAFTATTTDTRQRSIQHNHSSLHQNQLKLSLSTRKDNIISKEEEESEFTLRTRQLCEDRNLKLEKIKNARDLCSPNNSPIQPGRIIRCGRVSDATDRDLSLLKNDIGIKTLVDLRSYTELKDDLTLDREVVFGDFVDMVWDERKDVVKVLNQHRSRVEQKKGIVDHVKELVGGAKKGIDVATHLKNETVATVSSLSTPSGGGVDDTGLLKVLSSAAELAEATEACDDCRDDDDDDDDDIASEKPLKIKGEHIDEDLCEEEKPAATEEHSKKRFGKIYKRKDLVQDSSRSDQKERHFVSIMNEMKYVKGTLTKVRKRDLAKAIIKSPGAIVSKRVRSSCKDVFLNKINAGGLPLLNEFLLKQGAPGIKYVLDLCKDTSRHPIAFYCTAGKDRTGMIAAIMLAAAGVPDEDIVEDYSLSANVYAEMNDHKAMVGALSQRNLDAKTFLGAPPAVMRDTLLNIQSSFGSVEGYLDYIGFCEEDRKELRSALLDE
jgi:hypothetical protein